MKKQRTYEIHHKPCGHMEKLVVWCKLSASFIKTEENLLCPECREVSK